MHLSKTNFLYAYCHIKDDQVNVNGERIVTGVSNSNQEFFKINYQHLQLDYPKFFKMDELCKLSVIAAEYIMNEIRSDIGADRNIAILLSNASSTYMTDRKHQETISDKDNFFPSPAVFVYTLPNISIGEISIRHKIQGENGFFITEKFDSELITSQVNLLLNQHKANYVLAGWSEYTQNGYECFLYLVGKEEKGLGQKNTSELITKLYNSI